MRREATRPDDKRVSLRLSADLWRRLRVEAAQRDASTTLLINELLEEKLTEAEAQRRRELR